MRNLELGRGSDWWIGREVNCRTCGTKFVLDACDGDKINEDSKFTGMNCFVINCPGCRRGIYFKLSESAKGTAAVDGYFQKADVAVEKTRWI